MANQLAGNPWIVDTANTVITTKNVRISKIEMFSYSAVGAIGEVQDRLGRIIAVLKGSTDLLTVAGGFEIGFVDGVQVPANITAGGGANLQNGAKLAIYYK